MKRAYSRELLRDILEWDIDSWKQAVFLWDQLGDFAGRTVLDVGSRHGGLSLYFALCGARVVCTDLNGPSPRAHELHQRHGVSDRITYQAVNAAAMPFEDGSFDVVCFKSVLGAVGGAGGLPLQAAAMGEMHRVLRPGGLLLFAENTRGSLLHRLLRRLFVPWAARWRYPTLGELRTLLAPFSSHRMECHGFLATLGRSERQRSALHAIDLILNPVLPAGSKYFACGYARR